MSWIDLDRSTNAEEAEHCFKKSEEEFKKLVYFSSPEGSVFKGGVGRGVKLYLMGRRMKGEEEREGEGEGRMERWMRLISSPPLSDLVISSALRKYRESIGRRRVSSFMESREGGEAPRHHDIRSPTEGSSGSTPASPPSRASGGGEEASPTLSQALLSRFHRSSLFLGTKLVEFYGFMRREYPRWLARRIPPLHGYFGAAYWEAIVYLYTLIALLISLSLLHPALFGSSPSTPTPLPSGGRPGAKGGYGGGAGGGVGGVAVTPFGIVYTSSGGGGAGSIVGFFLQVLAFVVPFYLFQRQQIHGDRFQRQFWRN